MKLFLLLFLIHIGLVSAKVYRIQAGVPVNWLLGDLLFDGVSSPNENLTLQQSKENLFRLSNHSLYVDKSLRKYANQSIRIELLAVHATFRRVLVVYAQILNM